MAQKVDAEFVEPNSNWDNKFYSKKHHDGGFGPLFLIFLGLIFLLNNFGYLPADFWSSIWRFWPLLLILIGLKIILGRSLLANITLTLVGLVLILLVLANLSPSFSNQFNIRMHQFFPGYFGGGMMFSPSTPSPFDNQIY